MISNKKRPTTVVEYIALAPKESQKKLREMRAIVRKIAPKATESLKWGMPALSSRRILVIYGAFAHHIGFYPTPSAGKQFVKELSKFKTGKGSVQFPLDKPLPKALIHKMVAFRIQEEATKDKKWRP